MTDAQIDAVFNGMPGGAFGFLTEWGYRDFARAILVAHERELARLRAALRAAVEADAQTPRRMSLVAESCGCWSARVSGNAGAVGEQLSHLCEVHKALAS